jgi:hypothetical protein
LPATVEQSVVQSEPQRDRTGVPAALDDPPVRRRHPPGLERNRLVALPPKTLEPAGEPLDRPDLVVLMQTGTVLRLGTPLER